MFAFSKAPWVVGMWYWDGDLSIVFGIIGPRSFRERTKHQQSSLTMIIPYPAIMLRAYRPLIMRYRHQVVATRHRVIHYPVMIKPFYHSIPLEGEVKFFPSKQYRITRAQTRQSQAGSADLIRILLEVLPVGASTNMQFNRFFMQSFHLTRFCSANLFPPVVSLSFTAIDWMTKKKFTLATE